MNAELDQLLVEGYREGLFTAGSAAVSVGGIRSFSCIGSLSSEPGAPATTQQSLFDLASITKTFVAAAAVVLIDAQVLDPDAPLVNIRPVGSGSGSQSITSRMLLTHVSGLPAESMLWRAPGVSSGDALEQVVSAPLESAPGETFRYSCVGYVALGAVLESVTGRSLDEVLRTHVLAPLGVDSVVYGPVDPSATAATERQEHLGRGLVHGVVHDELSCFLGGRVGNAGLFGDAAGVLALAEGMLGGGPFSPNAVSLMSTDALTDSQRGGHGQAFGPRVCDPGFMGDVDAIGHTGFTGTMWIALPNLDTAAVLLTNRVHPHRERTDLGPFRKRFTETIARLARAKAKA